MSISEYMDSHTWLISRDHETREEPMPDLTEYMEMYDDTLRDEFLEMHGEDMPENQQTMVHDMPAWELYYQLEPFQQFCDREYEDYKRTHNDYEGYLKAWDVYMACDEATVNIHLEQYKQRRREEIQEEYEEWLDDWRQEYEAEVEEEDIDLTFEQWLEENMHPTTLDEFIEEEFDLEREFFDKRIGDDYAPIWGMAYEFPSSYTAEQLNEFDIPCLVFFEMDIGRWGGRKTFVSFTACNLSLRPAYELAYLKYSNLSIGEEEIKEALCGIQRSSLDYYKHILGSKTQELIEFLGEELVQRADEIGREKMREFEESLNAITEARDSGEMGKDIAGLTAVSAFFKSNRCEVDTITEDDEDAD